MSSNKRVVRASNLKIRKRKFGAHRESRLAPIYDEILQLEEGQVLMLDLDADKTVEATRAAWTQRLVTKVRPMRMALDGVDRRSEMAVDYEAVLFEDDSEHVGIHCVNNTYTEDMAEMHRARAEKQRETRANNAANKAEADLDEEEELHDEEVAVEEEEEVAPPKKTSKKNGKKQVVEEDF